MRVQFRQVGAAHRGATPLDTALEAGEHRDVAEQGDFRQRRGILEVRAGRRAAAARAEKVLLVRAFDAACDITRSAFIRILNEFMLIEQVVMVPQTVKRLERIC